MKLAFVLDTNDTPTEVVTQLADAVSDSIRIAVGLLGLPKEVAQGRVVYAVDWDALKNTMQP